MTTVVDAHVHAWDPGRLAYPWLAAHPPLVRRIVPADLDGRGVPLAGRVLVEADCRPDQADAETAWLLDLARADPRHARGGGRASGSSAARPSGPASRSWPPSRSSSGSGGCCRTSPRASR